MLTKKNYRIVFSDIDGTILNNNKDVSAETSTITNHLFQKKNIPTVLISARMPSAISPLSKKLCPNAPIIAYNGALILIPENGQYKVLQSLSFPSNIAKTILEQSQTERFHVGVFHEDQWIVNQHDKWTDHEIFSTGLTPEVLDNKKLSLLLDVEMPRLHKIMVMASSSIIDRLANEITKSFKNIVTVYRSSDIYMEITPASSSKKLGVEVMLNHLGINPSEAIAFGDNYNDLEMLKFVGMGIAVENARETVKAAAKMVTGHSKQNGVAEALQQIFSI